MEEKNTTFNLEILPQRSGFIAGHRSAIKALVKVQAPAWDEDAGSSGKPLNLAIVIDRSGSMSGRPLAEAKRCAHNIVDNLGANDRVSIVTYDDLIDIDWASSPVVDRAPIHREIDRIREGGTTNLYGGWQAAAEELHRVHDDSMLSRILLLSDGCANRGTTDIATITAGCASMAEQGVSTSTYGLGQSFNEELMIAMAQAGRGESYYGESAEDLLEPFQEEFSLLKAMAATDIQLSLEPLGGTSIKILNDLREAGNGQWRMPDLPRESEVWALIELQIPDQHTAPAGQDIPILKAVVRGKNLREEGTFECTDTLRLPSVPVEAWASLEDQPQVVQRDMEVRFARLQSDIRTAAYRGDWVATDQLLQEAETLVADHPWLREALVSLQRYAKRRDRNRLGKEALYASAKSMTRKTMHNEIVREFDAKVELDRPRFLRRQTEQGKRARPE